MNIDLTFGVTWGVNLTLKNCKISDYILEKRENKYFMLFKINDIDVEIKLRQKKMAKEYAGMLGIKEKEKI